MTDLRALAAEIRADPAPLDAYAGRSLADAFAAVALRDARFWDAQRSVLGRTVGGMTCNSGGDGRLWPSRSGLWPVSLFPWPHDLIAGWVNPDVVRYGTEVDADGDELHQPWADPSDDLTRIHDAADVVAALLGRFLSPLRDGRVVASGHAASGGMALGPISPAVWSRPATRFDAINSGVARSTGWAVDQSAFAFRAKRFRFEVTAPEFEAVTLDLADAAGDEKPTGGRRGRPRRVSYSEAMQAVFTNIMRDGLPENGAALCKMLETELYRIDGRSPDLSKLREMISERDQTLYGCVLSPAPK